MKTVFALMMLCMPIVAHAADPAVPQPDAKDKKVCRTEEATGSLFVKRVCHTKAEWAAIEVERQRSADQFHDQSRVKGADTIR